MSIKPNDLSITTSDALHPSRTDTPLSITNHTTNQTYYYHRDHQGSIVALTNEQGNIVEHLTYDGHYGKILKHTKEEETLNPYGYTGRETDQSDLYYYRARYYDPHTQRFLSSDPIEFESHDWNFYRYVSNDPVNFRDPSGLKWNSDDYMDHYNSKKGTTKTLTETGLFDDFMNSEQIKNGINAVFDADKKLVESALKKKCKTQCGIVSIKDLYVHEKDTPYSFQWALGKTIVVMGNGTMFHKGKCSGTMDCSTGKFTGNCNLHFYVRDKFGDPYDWFDMIPGEQGFGTPYKLTLDTNISRSF